MDPKVEAIVVILTAVSVIIIVFDIIFDPTGAILTFIYAFDLGVVVILAIDFYFRAKESPNKRRFILTHCYEIPALIPLVFFGLIESNHVYDVALRSLRLVRLFRLIILFSRSARIVESTNNRGTVYNSPFFDGSHNWSPGIVLSRIECRGNKDNLIRRCFLVGNSDRYNRRLWRYLSGHCRGTHNWFFSDDFGDCHY